MPESRVLEVAAFGHVAAKPAVAIRKRVVARPVGSLVARFDGAGLLPENVRFSRRPASVRLPNRPGQFSWNCP